MISLPPSFFSYTRVSREGAAGRAWAESLPALVDELCVRWSLTIDGAPMHGANGIAVPVVRRDGGAACVLKVAWLDQELRNQIVALALWDGHGMVRLLDASVEDGALLLERLDASRSLRSLPLEDSLTVAGELLRRQAVPAPADADLPPVAGVAEAFVASAVERSAKLGDPVPSDDLTMAVGLARELATVTGDLLVNHDLHDENILAAEREPWLAIDPRVLVGVPEYGIAQLLWWRLDDMPGDKGLRDCLDLLVSTAGLDGELTWTWTLVRSVDYWLWGLENGLTIDPARCARVVETLTSP
ncbi:aminoglycoside phosphotransferase family protein [Actinopolymorpha sp. B11F2]|uniref:aminoglycoside phosphotransferase family protein n=1 Tax=Actinopolymorpha sp. B11F2 TaxID=3160862 RepID=UPI0032E46D3E